MITREIRQFRKKLKEGYVIGPFSKTSDPAFVEMLGHAGFDFVIIDLEHGPNTIETAQNLVRGAQIGGVFPIIRVKEDAYSVIGEALDIGAGGVEVPQVSTSKDAERVVRHAKFAPEGQRGVCRFVRAADYSSLDRFRYFQEANESIVIIHLEGQEAVDNLDEILSVDGIDILFIGPYDLSQSLKVSGQVDHPLVIEKMQEIVRRCVAKEKAVGTFVDTPQNAAKWRDLGVSYLSYSVDTGIFTDACRGIVKSVRGG